MTISLFCGEFLYNPVPLEISQNQCNYACSYCYARGKDNNRKVDLSLFNNTVKRAFGTEPRSLICYLIRNRYPIALSNHVDPFCSNNQLVTEQMIDVLDFYEVPIWWETKGGKEARKFIDTKKYKEVWYVTITGDKDIISKVEPGAPSYKERMELVQEIVESGNEVLIGLNPLVLEWWTDLEKFFSELQKLGVKRIWTEPLHLARDHLQFMSKYDFQALGMKLIANARKRTPDLGYDVNDIVEIGVKYGIDIYSSTRMKVTDFWQVERECYGIVYPTLLDLAIACEAQMGKDEDLVFSYPDFEEYFMDRLPKNENFNSRDYLGSVDRKFVQNAMNLKNSRGFKAVLWTLYTQNVYQKNGKNAFYRGSICNTPLFSYLSEYNEKTNHLDVLTDENDLPLILYSRDKWKTSNMFTDIDYYNKLKQEG